MPIHKRFEAQARENPGATAIASEGGKLSYADLNGRANQLARFLASHRVGAGARVGICCERSIELLVGIYGILKTGAAYVPMDPAYPADRLEYMAEAARLEFVLTQSHLTGAAGILRDTRRIVLDEPSSEWSDRSPENLDAPVTPDDLIYIIFTSGTTGRPKGAGVYHRGFSNLIDWFVTEFQISAADRVLLVSSPSFDLTQKNLFAPLVTGGTICLPAVGPYEVTGLTKAIREHGITLINCTPSAFYPLVEQSDGHAMLETLRVAFLGGEPILLPRLRPWLTSPTCHAEVANTYGPTECTDICAFHRLNRTNMDDYPFIPLGRAVTNAQLVVVDENMERCAIGETGELFVGGTGVGAGYLNDPELTRQKFVPNPFSEINGSLIYGTGDQVRWCSPGILEFLGRKDHQVKIRGFRVELHEIESVLQQYPSVRNAVVIVTETPSLNGAGVQLKAYYTAKAGEQTPAQDLRAFVGSRLPEYMVPHSFQQIAEFPLSPNGKVDRKALAAIGQSQPTGPGGMRGENDLQRSIITIWSTVLGVNNVGLDDNFFDIGGDSLTLAQVHSRLEKLTGSEFPITQLFAHTTVRGLSEHFSGLRTAAARNAEVLTRAEHQRRALIAGRNRRP